MGNMKMQNQKSRLGFTLVELMVSMALGLIVMAAMASLFKTGMNATVLVQQRAEAQENMRAAVDLMVKDISLAGAGLPTGGIQLPTGKGNNGSSKYGCDQTTTCYVPNGTYPTGNFLYGIIPGYQDGVQGSAVIPAAPAPAINDSITVVYADYNFPLYEWYLTFTGGTSGAAATLACNTNYGSTQPAVTSAGGIQKGDVIMVSGGGVTGVGEVTNVSSTSGSACSPATMDFANADPLNINQSGAASGNLNAVATAAAGANCQAYRLFVVTYYIMVPGAGQTPRLMRQVNGLTPVPVADDIINLQFAYDTYNSSVTPAVLDPNQPNPIGAAESPNNIQKVNLVVMGQSINNYGNKSQNLALATSVSAGNMTFRSQTQY
jgi:prepilin-type N-terminal cleavage/methylation domain-containing protein